MKDQFFAFDNNSLAEYIDTVQRARRLPAPPVNSPHRQVSADSNRDKYAGPFKVELIPGETPTLQVGPGHAYVNGKYYPVSELKELVPQAGILCLAVDTLTLALAGYSFGAPSASRWPIAELAKDGDTWTIKPYYTTVAVFMIVAACLGESM